MVQSKRIPLKLLNTSAVLSQSSLIIMSHLKEPLTFIFIKAKAVFKKIETARNTPIDGEIIDNFLKENTWEKRLEIILSDLRQQ